MSNPALCSPRLGFIPSIAFLLFAFAVALPALADSHARIVRLSYVDGDVELDKGDGHGYSTAYENMPIAHQSKLWSRDGEAEVELEDGSSIRLTPDTIVAFTDLSLDGSGHRATTVELQQGTAYFDIRSHESDRFELQFGNNRAQLVTTSRFRVDADKGNYELATISGEVQVSNGSANEVVVKKDETIRLNGDDPDRYYLAKGIDAETYDGWDNERAKSHDQAVAAAANSGYNGLTYGMSDLAANGNYFYVPGYGYMWRPNAMGLDWDPFADGYWVPYPGFGYTFVSAYPWGWAPYRYGSWQFVNGYGWCWRPGSNWNNWNTSPVVVSGPPHYRPPMRPHHGPTVIVVNRGVTSSAPPHRIIVDNDSLASRRPHSEKVVTASGEVVRRGQVSATTPASGFVSTNSSTTAGAPIVIPSRPMIPQNGWRQGEDVHTGSFAATPRESRIPSVTSVQSAPVTQNGVRNDSHPVSPRMEPHVANSAPAMRSAPAVHSAPSMHSGGGFSSGGAMHSAPSMSGGGGHMGGVASSSGGGGSHSSSGGSSHR